MLTLRHNASSQPAATLGGPSGRCDGDSDQANQSVNDNSAQIWKRII